MKIRHSYLLFVLSALSAFAQESAPAVDAGKDFTPGSRVIVATDFSKDEVGMFPRVFRLKGGNMEVAMVNGKRYLRATSGGEFVVALPEVLPQRFTLEFDCADSGTWYQDVKFDDRDDPYFIHLSPAGYGGIMGPDEYKVMADVPGAEANKPVRVQIMADGQHVKVYMNGTRVANAPNADLGRSKMIRFVVNADQDNPALFGDFRLAAGGKDLYQALNDSGRATAEGIFFDTNSDRLRPESDAALKGIAETLAQHPDMRLLIEGHTDNAGQAAANQTLSEKRAAAVKASLVSKYKIDAGRLETKGFGSSKPVASNDTPAGQQSNRRVELVKL